jgi:hypothetical protein
MAKVIFSMMVTELRRRADIGFPAEAGLPPPEITIESVGRTIGEQFEIASINLAGADWQPGTNVTVTIETDD